MRRDNFNRTKSKATTIYITTPEAWCEMVKNFGPPQCVQTAAGFVGVSRQRIYQLFASGKLTRIVILQVPHVSHWELQEWANSPDRHNGHGPKKKTPSSPESASDGAAAAEAPLYIQLYLKLCA